LLVGRLLEMLFVVKETIRCRYLVEELSVQFTCDTRIDVSTITGDIVQELEWDIESSWESTTQFLHLYRIWN
jgi:hypothetical protein